MKKRNILATTSEGRISKGMVTIRPLSVTFSRYSFCPDIAGAPHFTLKNVPISTINYKVIFPKGIGGLRL